MANFFINGTSGMLIVSLTLMQRGAQFSAMEAGLLTLGFAVVVILFIRVGESCCKNLVQNRLSGEH